MREGSAGSTPHACKSKRIGKPGEVVVPDGTDVRAMVATYEPAPRPTGTAVVRARGGAGHALRHRATSVEPAGGGWDRLTLPYWDVEDLAEQVAGHGAAVVAEDPPELRKAVQARLEGVLQR